MLKTQQRSRYFRTTGAQFKLPSVGGGINMIGINPSHTFMLHRSVPPSDMYGPQQTPTRLIRTAQVSTVNSSTDFVNRSARPVTTPSVVGFDSVDIGQVDTPRGMSGFFPPVKRHMVQLPNQTGLLNEVQMKSPRTAPGSMNRIQEVVEMVPAPSPTNTDYQSLHSKTQLPQTRGTHFGEPLLIEDINAPAASSKRIGLRDVNTRLQQHVHKHQLESAKVDDLSELPRPTRMVMTHHDVPFVYRYKVKKNMSKLSKIMASRPPHRPDHIW